MTGADNDSVSPGHWLGLMLRRATLAISLL